MLYAALYMAATRTQVYFTAAQRRELDAIASASGRTLAEVVREAVDRYLAGAPRDPKSALAATFGAIPDLDVPSREEWERG
jgi:hypothetical protein